MHNLPAASHSLLSLRFLTANLEAQQLFGGLSHKSGSCLSATALANEDCGDVGLKIPLACGAGERHVDVDVQLNGREKFPADPWPMAKGDLHMTSANARTSRTAAAAAKFRAPLGHVSL